MSATHPGAPIADEDLADLAAALYPDDAYLQTQWLRGVRLVRLTARGWLLDPPRLPALRHEGPAANDPA